MDVAQSQRIIWGIFTFLFFTIVIGARVDSAETTTFPSKWGWQHEQLTAPYVANDFVATTIDNSGIVHTIRLQNIRDSVGEVAVSNLTYETWDNSTKLSSRAIATGDFGIHRRIDIELDSLGGAHLIFTLSENFADSVSDYYYVDLSDINSTPQLIVADGEQSFVQDIQALIDSVDRIHTFFSKNGTLHHAQLISGAWQLQALDTCTSRFSDFRSYASFDSLSSLHLIYHCRDSTQLHHTVFDGTSWSPKTVSDPHEGNLEYYLLSMDIGPSDTPILTYKHSDYPGCGDPIYVGEIKNGDLISSSIPVPYVTSPCEFISTVGGLKVEPDGDIHILLDGYEFDSPEPNVNTRKVYYHYRSLTRNLTSTVASGYVYPASPDDSVFIFHNKIDVNANGLPVITYYSRKSDSQEAIQATIWDLSFLTEEVFLPIVHK